MIIRNKKLYLGNYMESDSYRLGQKLYTLKYISEPKTNKNYYSVDANYVIKIGLLFVHLDNSTKFEKNKNSYIEKNGVNDDSVLIFTSRDSLEQYLLDKTGKIDYRYCEKKSIFDAKI